MDNQRRGFGKRFGIVIGCRVGRKGGVTTPFVTIDNFYHRERQRRTKLSLRASLRSLYSCVPCATIYRNNIPPWILSCRRREGEKMARMRRGGGSLCTATRLCNRRMTLVLNGTAGPKGKDRSISDGEAAEKRQRAPPFASFFPRSLRRLSRSAPRFIYNIIKY